MKVKEKVGLTLSGTDSKEIVLQKVLSEAIGFESYVVKKVGCYYYNIIQSDNLLTVFTPSKTGLRIRKGDFKMLNNLAERVFAGTHKELDYKNREYVSKLYKLREVFLESADELNLLKKNKI